MGVRIVLADREPLGAALRRFKKLLERNGVVFEMRRHESFHKPTQERRAKAFKKRFKTRMATLLAQAAGEQPVPSLVKARKAFWQKAGKP